MAEDLPLQSHHPRTDTLARPRCALLPLFVKEARLSQLARKYQTSPLFSPFSFFLGGVTTASYERDDIACLRAKFLAFYNPEKERFFLFCDWMEGRITERLPPPPPFSETEIWRSVNIPSSANDERGKPVSHRGSRPPFHSFPAGW